eukprot:PITA_09244
MAKMEALVFCALIAIQCFTHHNVHAHGLQSKSTISRHDFPPNFIFGAGTSAYQVEGAAAVDGRKPSIWDTYTHAGNMPDGSTGDAAADQYHHYKEDVALMNEMGLDAYRFSISWSRVIPDGRGAVNPKGLEYYNNLINELISHGVEPHITLYHFDLPQSLEDAYGGWLSPNIVEDFRAYAEVCFREFGDRVKFWTTFNEANGFTTFGYDVGFWPPKRCSYPFGFLGNCTAGNSTVEPYITGHYVLLSHAATVELYRQKFQSKQKGSIGISIYAGWYVPMTNSTEDIAATQRTIDFQFGWFIEPVMYGDYPSCMKKIVGSRLPSFTKQESEKLRGSSDFIGLIHYTTSYVSDSPSYRDLHNRDYLEDSLATESSYRNGVPIGEFSAGGLPVVPWGMQGLLEHFKQHYDNPPIIIYENGYAMPNMESLALSDALNDKPRIAFLHDYVESLLAAIRNGSNARGYFVWTLVDCFEVLYGYQLGFGLYGVDFKDTNLKRYPKLSARWYTDLLKRDQNYRLAGSSYSGRAFPEEHEFIQEI